MALATVSCESGPTSDWPSKGSGDDDNSEGPPKADAGVAAMDAAVRGDGGSTPATECGADAGDAGAHDAGCEGPP